MKDLFKLRPYQQDAVDAVFSEIKKTIEPVLLDLATGAGKSIIVAEIAKRLFNISGKKVLCIAPSKELIEQNHSKYISYGYGASIFCASAGEKCSKHPVIFGSPISILNSIDQFESQFAAVIIDECHKITKAIISIVNSLRVLNPNIRVIGLTATPYRLNTGYIFEIDENGMANGVEKAKDPYFKKLVYKLGANDLIKQGYLSKPVTEVHDGYDTSDLEMAKTGDFTPESLKKVFVGHGRLTSKIVREVVELTENRKSVMFFAATIEHAHEIVASLPHDDVKMVIGSTDKREREQILNDFKAFKFKYIVNVAVLTTGFDAPAVDCVAILRRTSSASLLQQIIGRGLRLADGKKDCLILDYAENIHYHKLENDLFSPEIKTCISKEAKDIECICKACGAANVFKKRQNRDGLNIDLNGYFVDLTGEQVVDIDTGQPYPAHFGRRCRNTWLQRGEYIRCDGRWSFKECPSCKAENDIAAKKCIDCKAEIVDPNKKLQLKIPKEKPTIKKSKVERLTASIWSGRSGTDSVKIDYYIERGDCISVWYFPKTNIKSSQDEWRNLCLNMTGRKSRRPWEFIKLVKDGITSNPKEISYYRKNKYYKVVGYEF